MERKSFFHIEKLQSFMVLLALSLPHFYVSMNVSACAVFRECVRKILSNKLQY